MNEGVIKFVCRRNKKKKGKEKEKEEKKRKASILIIDSSSLGATKRLVF